MDLKFRRRHPRFRPHFAPTSGSWLNFVERWFAELTTASCARRSVTELGADVRKWFNNWNTIRIVLITVVLCGGAGGKRYPFMTREPRGEATEEPMTSAGTREVLTAYG